MPGYDESNRYFVSTAVFLNEVIKLIFCLGVSLYKERNIKRVLAEVNSSDVWKLAIPAALYTLQNSLQFVAVSHLDAATFQVTYQLKILTTAFFSVTILKRLLTNRQWFALLLLTVGIALVQTPTDAIVKFFFDVEEEEAPASAANHATMNQFVGLVAVAVSCLLSGLAGVYFEKVLKGSKASLWTRNVQLSFFSLFPAFFFGVLAKDGSQVALKGFFHGYNYIVWLSILLQAVGGIIVALCVKYADNIAKNFATSVSIIISCIASLLVFDDFKMSINFFIGAAVVIYATMLYSNPEKKYSEGVLKKETA
ncbi:hypothetical protein TRVA0_040S00562 [Trichomonascus vanleenenianus]|uniref:uncharacterized protein n=1 Tax=Trichomonascus vanleenenianus TaxID=2268995 RepID=UPI003ECB6D71